MQFTKIYFDMDGVLVDFDRGVEELAHHESLNQGISTDETDSEMWDAVRTVDHFYARLEPMEGALELFHRLDQKYPGTCEILTGVPKPRRRIAHAAEDKKEWIRAHLGAEVIVHTVYKEEKKNFCTGPESVLIDDFDRNINAWKACGGTGILYRHGETDVEEILSTLER